MKKFIELFCREYKLGFSLLFILFLLMISYLVYINNDNSVKASNTGSEINDIVSSAVADIKNNQKIKIDVKGLVVNPGVYELDEGSRVIDAIEAAGGILDDGDSSSLNLSKILKDENVIIVGSIQEEEPKYFVEYVYKECTCPEYNDACISDNSVVNNKDNSNNNQNSSDSEDVNNGLISINSASKEELQTLSGVGESKALAIIKYREENGPFTSIDEIKNVSGIGDALFEKIKDNITV